MKLNKRFFLLSLCVLSIIQSTAQKKLDWAFGIGDQQGQYADEVLLDQDKNVYTIGQFYGTVDFDPGPGVFNLTSIPGSFVNQADVYIQKVDSNGQFLWAKTFGGLSLEQVNDAVIDGSGNLILVGAFQDTVDFDPGNPVYQLNSYNNFADIYILKLDHLGKFKWAKRYGGALTDRASGVISEVNDNLIICGSYFDSVVFNPNAPAVLTDSALAGGFLLQLDSNGVFQWVKTMTGGGSCIPNKICKDQNNNLFLTGSFKDTIDFDPSIASVNMTTAVGDNHMFIASYDVQGQFLWVRDLNPKNFIIDNGITADNYGNIYVTGEVQDSIDFDPGPNSDWYAAPMATIYVLKLDINGNYQWVKLLGGNASCGFYHDIGQDIKTNAAGDVFICGEFCGQEDFDPGFGTHFLVSPSQNPEGFVSQLDANGNFIWAQRFGGTGFDRCLSLDVSGDEIYTCGNFNGTADFDPSVGTYNLTGQVDFFVMKLSNCQIDQTTQVVDACKSFTWTNGFTYYSSNSFAKDTFVNTSGCDSIVSLQLTIHLIDSTVSQSNDTLLANASSVTYQWLDCNNNYSPIAGANQQNFVPSVNGSYAVEVSDTYCKDTSICTLFTNVSIIEFDKLNILVYPSPTQSVINVKSDRPLDTFMLYDVVGKLVLSEELSAVQSSISVNHLPDGIYMFEVRSRSGMSQGKIVIQRN